VCAVRTFVESTRLDETALTRKRSTPYARCCRYEFYAVCLDTANYHRLSLISWGGR